MRRLLENFYALGRRTETEEWVLGCLASGALCLLTLEAITHLTLT